MPLPDAMDTSVGWSFGLEIDGVQIKQIQSVSGLKVEADVIELKHNTNDGKYINKKLPGRPQSGEVQIVRGLTDDKTFQDWIKKVSQGDMKGSRKGGSIIVYDYMGTAIKRYKLINVWPKSLEIGQLQAGDTSVLTETLTLSHEGCVPE